MTRWRKGSLVLTLALMTSAPVVAMEPTLELYIEDPLRPVFHGATNLPDGSELMLTLSRPEAGYTAQTKMTVASGHFKTEAFSAKRQALNPGRYRIKISMSVAALQPAAVQAVIGNRGQHMTGPLVIGGQFGTTFEFVAQRQLGGPPNAALDAAAKAQSLADLREWLVKSCTTNIDFVNAAVRSGAVTGLEIVGAERKARIDACIAEVNSHPLK